MKIAGKSFRDYLAIMKSFWVALFILMALMVAARRSVNIPTWTQTLLSVSGALVIIGAGWTSVKRHGFELRHVAIAALFLSLGVHWSLPIFHSVGEIAYLLFINSFVYAALAILGGFLAKLSAK